MTIELRSLDNLDADAVEQNFAEVTQRVAEQHAGLDLRRGVFADLLLYPHALLETQQQANVADYLAARSLKAIEADPTLADADLVDDVLSNFGVTRREGRVAQGLVTIVRTLSSTIVLPAGAVFEANGLRFVTPRVFTAKAEASQINSSSDRLITSLGNGNFAFTVEVEAEEVGVGGLLRKDVFVAPVSKPSGYVTSYATSDFTAGRDTETNEALIARFQRGMAAKVVSGRTNMLALLEQQEAFEDILAASFIGYGDAEMLRDQRTIFPIHHGGRVDWYIRSSQQLYRKALTKTATLVEKIEEGLRGVWQVNITRDDAPGFYEITNIHPTELEETAGTLDITVDNRGIDMTGDGFLPDVADEVEGAYTAFQTAVIRFTDTITDASSLSVGDTASYDMEARGQLLVKDLQDYVSDRGVHNLAADVLIKAAVPCTVQLSFTINKRSGEDDPDLAAIKNALAQEVALVGFIGRLSASQLQDVVHGFLENDQTVGAIDMFGIIRRPDGSLKYLRSTELLLVPDEPDKMVTARTVQFFTSPDDIAITVATVVPATI